MLQGNIRIVVRPNNTIYVSGHGNEKSSAGTLLHYGMLQGHKVSNINTNKSKFGRYLNQLSYFYICHLKEILLQHGLLE